MSEKNNVMPLLALRGLNVFPEMLLSFDVERQMSIAALAEAAKNNNIIFLAAQKDISVDVPQDKDIYTVGTVCRIRQQLRQPRSNICRVMVEGIHRARIVSIKRDNGCMYAELEELNDLPDRVSDTRREALVRNCLSLYDEYLKLNPDMLNEQILGIMANPDFNYVINFIAQNVHLALEDKQRLLEQLYPSKRMSELAKLMRNEINVLNIEKELNEATSEQLNKNQRDYYLREEMKVIRAELGEDTADDDIEELRGKVRALKVSDEIREKLLKEVSRLAKQPFGSSEASVIRNYLDVCLELPWGTMTEESIDIAKARKNLDDDHFGLDKVKERVIEYLAVKKLTPEVKGGLICLVGPPGTGKTSIAMSVAKAVNRKLVRVSLGGVHDEADIRGHRKTYIGAMPGRIVNGLIQAKSMNPLMVLDEIDKLGSDYKGDPSAALLEALDPEQNSTFRDHFLELPIDLSQVFFITTANSLNTIPRPLLDRMEIIELSSYTDEEKLSIAKKHLLPKQRKKHGLSGTQLKLTDDAIRALITGYTRESGVRQLERELASVCRKAALGISTEKFKSVSVKPAMLQELIGPVKFKPEEERRKDCVGLVRGLAYTTVGGEILDVEVAVVEGSGKFELTGNLGDVMKESAHAAVTYIRSVADKLGIEPDFYKTKDIHVHFPEAATPKDGPSAGITMTVAIISALTGLPVRHDVAMTGEITLRGRVLAIGGLREKTMAALRNGITNVIIPADNVSDLEQIDQAVRKKLNFIPASRAEDVLDFVLVRSKQQNDLQLQAMQPNCSEVRCSAGR